MPFTNLVENAILRKRERLEVYEALDPGKTALVVIDMQQAFCGGQGVLAVESARSIVPQVNRLAQSLRTAGGSVFWIRMTIASEADWPVYLGDIVSRRDVIDAVVRELAPSGAGSQLWHELDVQSGDAVLTKNRFSAFLPRACDLMESLRHKGIDTVIIAGTLTDVCCESSARDAAMNDFKVIMVSDANATRTESAHAGSLDSIAQCFGDVRSTADVVSLIQAAHAG